MDGDASFWAWCGLAYHLGLRGADGRPTAAGRARALDFLERAVFLARSEAERARIREVRALVELGR